MTDEEKQRLVLQNAEQILQHAVEVAANELTQVDPVTLQPLVSALLMTVAANTVRISLLEEALSHLQGQKVPKF